MAKPNDGTGWRSTVLVALDALGYALHPQDEDDFLQDVAVALAEKTAAGIKILNLPGLAVTIAVRLRQHGYRQGRRAVTVKTGQSLVEPIDPAGTLAWVDIDDLLASFPASLRGLAKDRLALRRLRDIAQRRGMSVSQVHRELSALRHLLRPILPARTRQKKKRRKSEQQGGG